MTASAISPAASATSLPTSATPSTAASTVSPTASTTSLAVSTAPSATASAVSTTASTPSPATSAAPSMASLAVSPTPSMPSSTIFLSFSIFISSLLEFSPSATSTSDPSSLDSSDGLSILCCSDFFAILLALINSFFSCSLES